MTGYRVRSSAICVQNNHLLVLKHEDPFAGSFWGLPGGEIEPGETPLEAALRETLEETGYSVELVFDPGLVVDYDFVWQDTIYHCRTHWFAVRPRKDCVHHPRAGDAAFITELRWIPVNDWKTIFSDYPVLQNAVKSVLIALNKRSLVKL